MKPRMISSGFRDFASLRVPLAVAFSAFLVGCGPQRPVLYPDAHLNTVGAAQAEQDINDCIALAQQAGVGASKAGQVAGKTATAAAVGGAGGAAAGAVRGNAGRGAALGAAGGAAGGFVSGMIKSKDLDPVTKRYVEVCLQERGYRVLGWK
jgi:outer membrane lipoprotein SlyB